VFNIGWVVDLMAAGDDVDAGVGLEIVLNYVIGVRMSPDRVKDRGGPCLRFVSWDALPLGFFLWRLGTPGAVGDDGI